MVRSGMERTNLWTYFDKDRILYEDDDLIAVNKPAGVPSQAANPDRPDDVVMRLRAFLAERDGRADPYIGVHQRLDRDTSGVLLFTKRPEVNAALARQFEGRTLKKHYLAAVTGWPAHAREITLDDQLRKGDGGRMEVVAFAPRGRSAPRRPSGTRGPQRPPPTRSDAGGAQRALTHVRPKTRKDDRTLLELRLETGRTHQARVQLAHAGAPIAGDPLYGGTLAPRLMLHAAGLELDHPRTGKRLVIRSEAPADMVEYVARGDRGASVYDDVPDRKSVV